MLAIKLDRWDPIKLDRLRVVEVPEPAHRQWALVPFASTVRPDPSNPTSTIRSLASLIARRSGLLEGPPNVTLGLQLAATA